MKNESKSGFNWDERVLSWDNKPHVILEGSYIVNDERTIGGTDRLLNLFIMKILSAILYSP